MEMKYRPIVGLEIHVELTTKSKMFCQCEANYFGAEPNTHTCPVCLGMPGGLPVANREAIRRSLLLAMALNCEINQQFKFDRKHYMYPDLAKGYQISQYDQPMGINGKVKIATASGVKEFRIKRVHLEEDTGKLIHLGQDSLVDFNRGGVPLVEIVTEPDFDNGDDVKAFLEELQVIVRYLGIANADMEKGDMRLEPNISVQLAEKWPELPPYKVEVKNINSFKFVKKAIEYEVERHIEYLERGELPPQETRGYNSNDGSTISQRIKEDAADYRYFPDPDIPLFNYDDKLIADIRSDLPELPVERLDRFVEQYKVRFADALLLTRDRSTAEQFEKLVQYCIENKSKITAQEIANSWLNNKVDKSLTPDKYIIKLEEASKPVETDQNALTDSIEKAISANEKAVADVKTGKNPNSIMFLVGQVMKEMKGKADAQVVRKALEERLT